MNQKIVGIIPLIVAMMFVAVFAVGDNQVAAASGPTSQSQTVTVNVKDNIALSVTPSAITMKNSAGTDPMAGDTSYSGAGASDNNIIVTNVGNVPITVSVNSGSATFSDGGSNTFTPTAFTINSQSGSSVNIGTALSTIATAMQKNGATSTFNTHLTLGIPADANSATYTNSLSYTAVKSS